MKAQDYIEQRLRSIKDIKTERSGTLADFVYATLLSKKFRKYSVSPEAHGKIRTAIELNIKNNEPIKVGIPFGTYKLWRLQESPEPDWAELFAMIYYAHWLRPITTVYEPGVWFDFCGDDAILDIINNTPLEDTERYKKVLRELIAFVTPYLPQNFKFTLNPVGERYNSREEFLADLHIKVEELKQQPLNPLTEREIEMIKFNIRLKDGETVDVEKNRLFHDAYLKLQRRRAHHKVPNMTLISSTPFGDRTSIPIGTTKTSVAKFQTGVGVLKKVADSFIEYIYSPSQLEQAHFSWEETEISGLHGKNFRKIRVVN